MNKRIKDIIQAIFVAVLSGIILSLILSQPFNLNQSALLNQSSLKENENNLLNFNFTTVELKVLGSNNTIEIRQGKKVVEYQGGFIKGSNGRNIIFLSTDQALKVTLLGSNNKFIISKSLAEQVQFNDTGANNRVDIL